MIMLDASVLIAVLDASDPHHAAAQSVLADESDTLAMSVLTLAEVAVGPSRLGRTATLRDAVDALAVRVVPLDADHWAALAELRVTTGLRMPDCCVLHSALTHGARVATFDPRFNAAVQQVGLRTLGL